MKEHFIFVPLIEAFTEEDIDLDTEDLEIPDSSTKIENPEKLISTLNKLKAQNKEFKSAVKELETLKQQTTAAQKAKEEEQLKLEGQYAALAEKRIAEAEASYKQQLADYEKRFKKVETELNTFKTAKEALEQEKTTLLQTFEQKEHQASVKDAFLGAKGKPKLFDYFYAQHREAFKRTEEGKLVASVGDAEVEPTEYFTKLQEDEDLQNFFALEKPKGNGGLGSQLKDRNATTGNVRVFPMSAAMDMKKHGITPDDVKSGRVKFVP